MSGHLSLLRLDLDDPQVRADLRDASELHRSIMSAFPDVGGGGRARADMGILFRLTEEREEATVLVQSQVRPRWDDLLHVARGYLKAPPQVRPLEPLLDQIVRDTLWRFRLLANATVARQGRRHGLMREEDLVVWLLRRGEQLGARLASAEAPTFTARDLGEIRGRRGRDRITVRQAAFEGVLQVTDPAALKRAVIAGVGRARAYGCGLLSLAPVA
ncbi:MAG: type I-E CRISPR-associated protein Cas6/Cse3/CasE [Solirubrobacteraceae bacterium]